MKFIAVNGSPRKNWNTAMLLESAVEGAKSKGADAELVHLYDIDFKGCHSCFACKLIGGKSYGRCAVKDGLTELLDKIYDADAFVVGSPVYYADVTGETRSFMERLFYPFMMYDKNYSSIFPKKIKTGFIYDMNQKEEMMKARGYEYFFEMNKTYMGKIFGSSEYITACNTYQFTDYSKYECSAFDPVAKKESRDNQFPIDRQKAYDFGASLVS